MRRRFRVTVTLGGGETAVVEIGSIHWGPVITFEAVVEYHRHGGLMTEELLVDSGISVGPVYLSCDDKGIIVALSPGRKEFGQARITRDGVLHCGCMKVN